MKRVPKHELAKPFNMDKHIYDFPLRVLIYKEDGEFVAHALEMDLLGYGTTQDKAIKALTEMIFCQLSFAHEKKDDRLLMFPAPKEIFERWEKAREAALRNEVIEDKHMNIKYVATCITIMRSEIREILSKRSRFTPLAEACG
jgi:hypothetical protein